MGELGLDGSIRYVAGTLPMVELAVQKGFKGAILPERSALEADVERETREAAQSRTNLNSTLAALAIELKGLNADLNKVKREVDAATKRQAATNDEAPPG